MLETLKEVFTNEVMYYVIVPIILLLFGWVKSWYDIRMQNKKMGYWKVKIRREPSFYNIAMKLYNYMLLNLLLMEFIQLGCSNIWGKFKSILCIGIIYVINNVIIVMYTIRKPRTKIELWTDTKVKYSLLLAICLIFNIIFFVEIIPISWGIVEITYCFSLMVWCYSINKCSDIIYILDKPYANIYIEGAEPVKYINVGSIKKEGSWIYVNRFTNGCYEETRIKESQIVRIDYYGEPIIVLKSSAKNRKK